MFNRYVPNRKLVGEKNEMTISYNGCKDLSYRVQKKKKKKTKQNKTKQNKENSTEKKILEDFFFYPKYCTYNKGFRIFWHLL